MQHILSEHSSLLILEKGEELITSLTSFAKENNVKGAWISGVGAASSLTIGYYDLDAREYAWKENSGMFEIMNLSGNITTVDNEPSLHIHGTFSGHDLAAFGGHVKELLVGITCELFITPFEAPGNRFKADQGGYTVN